MAFFTDQWTIAEISSKNTVLVRKSKNNILLERVVGETSINSREIIAKGVLEEYDLAIDLIGNIYILFQDMEGHLVLNILKDKKKEEINLTSDVLPKVHELNIIIKDKMIHLFYLIKISEEKMRYQIRHHYYNENKWSDSVIEEISVSEVLNPIRLIETENSILLLYCSNDEKIEVKEFNIYNLQWSDKVTLVDTENHKLFLDILKMNNIIHMAYGEFINGNLVIKYNQLLYNNGVYEKVVEEYISNEGSPAYPNIIFFENKLWITWVELNKIMSRCSYNKGINWETNIYVWNESRDIDFVRYKYLTRATKDNIHLQYSFGSIYPEVTFMGFGPLDNVVEIPIKKKKKMNL